VAVTIALEGTFGSGEDQLRWDSTVYEDWGSWGGPFTFAVTAEGEFWLPVKVDGLVKRINREGKVTGTFPIPTDRWVEDIVVRRDRTILVKYYSIDTVYCYDTTGNVLAKAPLPLGDRSLFQWMLFAFGDSIFISGDVTGYALLMYPMGIVVAEHLDSVQMSSLGWFCSSELWAASGGRYRIGTNPQTAEDSMTVIDEDSVSIVKLPVAEIRVVDYLGLDEEGNLYAEGYRKHAGEHENVLLRVSIADAHPTIAPLSLDSAAYHLAIELGVDGRVYVLGGPPTCDKWVIQQYTFSP